MINKPRKQSMRQTVDEYSPTYARAVRAIEVLGNIALSEAARRAREEKPVFVRGARVKPK